MNIWPCARAAVVCAPILASPIVASNAGAQPMASGSTHSSTSFTLAKYHEMEKADRQTLGLILTAMRETVFYVQKSEGKSVICASPKPIPVEQLMELVDQEIATPSNLAVRKYADNDQLAFIFVSAMKNAAYCD